MWGLKPIKLHFFGNNLRTLDNYIINVNIGLSKIICRCDLFISSAMSDNSDDPFKDSRNDQQFSSAALDPQANIRRARSAENVLNCFEAAVSSNGSSFNDDWFRQYNPLIRQNFYPHLDALNYVQYPPYYGAILNHITETYSNMPHFMQSNNVWYTETGPSGSHTALQSIPVHNVRYRHYVRRNNSAENVSNKSVNINPMVLKVLSKRFWEDVVNKKRKSRTGVTFTVMSYNVLAQDLVRDHPYLYKYHNPNSLIWEKRWKNIFEEIRKLSPDVMCLQEVQESHLSYFSKLETLGYKGVYKKRTGIRCDGCAIYYKAEIFDLVEYETVEFYQPNVTILNRDNVAIIAKLCAKSRPKCEFVVATTHLLYNPKRQDVRLAQTQLLLTEVERLSFRKKNGCEKPYLPIIITGDFNTTPDSAVYELISKGTLKYDHLSEKTLDNSKNVTHGNVLVPSHLEITDNCQHARLLQKRGLDPNISRTEEAALIKLHNSQKRITKITSEVIENPALFCTGTLSHAFAFKSVYGHGTQDDVEGTTFQEKWVTVDYIFYSGKKRSEEVRDDKLKLVSRYRLPLCSELGQIKLPNSILGSDHLCLIGKFKLHF